MIKNRMMYVMMMVFAVMVLTGCSSDDPTSPTANDDPITGNDDPIVGDPDKVTVYFFWGEGCPHCSDEKLFLEELGRKYSDDLEVKMFETWNDRENRNLFQEVAQAYGIEARGVPTTFIGEKHWVGYTDSMGQEMESKIQDCIEGSCPDPGDKID
ncbi:MAG: glutaredoxin family protein [Nanoarchaeota archaeon]